MSPPATCEVILVENVHLLRAGLSHLPRRICFHCNSIMESMELELKLNPIPDLPSRSSSTYQTTRFREHHRANPSADDGQQTQPRCLLLFQCTCFHRGGKS